MKKALKRGLGIIFNYLTIGNSIIFFLKKVLRSWPWHNESWPCQEPFVNIYSPTSLSSCFRVANQVSYALAIYSDSLIIPLLPKNFINSTMAYSILHRYGCAPMMGIIFTKPTIDILATAMASPSHLSHSKIQFTV